MNARMDELLVRLKNLEDEFEREVEARRTQFHYRLAQGRVVFAAEVKKEHRRLRTRTFKYLRDSTIGSLLIAPFVYVLIVPLALLDLTVWLYQLVCFRVWNITPVRRADFIALDRRHLDYLNVVQKLNCEFCSYANGLIAYVQEVAARSEQYWCPIKHAIRVKSPHIRYRSFPEYGDAAGFHRRLHDLRRELRLHKRS